MPECFIYKQELEQVKMSGCYSLMLGFAKPICFDFDAALVKDSDISWISVNNTKPERLGQQALLIHSTNKWADLHLEADQQVVLEYLLAETMRVTGKNLAIADYQSIHRWRYANIGKQGGKDFFLDIEHKLAALGDWCIQGRVEAAFLSAYSMAKFFNNQA